MIMKDVVSGVLGCGVGSERMRCKDIPQQRLLRVDNLTSLPYRQLNIAF